MTPKKADQAKLDKIVGLLRDVREEDVRAMLRKDAVVRLRVSKRVKAEIEAEAEKRSLSASAYLLSLHEAAMRKE